MSQPAYRGRFAPTPSGPLHFGSLVAALGSYLDARARGGEWLVRMEDVDPPRVVPGAADAILHSLEAYGFEWSHPVLVQSRRGEAYHAALDRLLQAGRVYGCTCSRKTLAETARMGVDGPIYPGACRGHPPRTGTALRFRVPDRRIQFSDGLLGRVGCDLAAECGDFVLRRADGVYAYHLAVVVDDADQGITHVVRGADLLTSTPRHIALQQALGHPVPAYLHLPVALDERGEKLSKQTLATPLDDAHPLQGLQRAARFLGLEVGAAGTLAEFWQLAAPLWRTTTRPPIRGRRMSP
ncbi:MAG: tRNA glutamyl-Q(34) synthetase GluQRS [Betaproteobacteria bacterium]|nr:tRNA glutamyl-Q(34) synthetase GluQRS [Betaproteobacteria bacterium]